jgi:hypothetical protein
MLKWRPGAERRIIWNDRQGDHFAATSWTSNPAKRTIPHPIYTVSPDGAGPSRPISAASTTSARLRLRGLPDPFAITRDGRIGIWRFDMEAATRSCSLAADIVRVRGKRAIFLQRSLVQPTPVNPTVAFEFLHRW